MLSFRRTLACSRCSDSRAREKNSRPPLFPPPPLPPPIVQPNSLPTYRRALLSERLEQASRTQQSATLQGDTNVIKRATGIC